jgi:hypothetical protein
VAAFTVADPVEAPLQAMLLPQGLGLIILLLLILRIEALRMHFKKFINSFR